MEDPDDASATSTDTVVQSSKAPKAPSDPTARFTPGTMLAGRYRLVSPLGKGGMGEVYRADDIRLGQPVALKFLPADLAWNQDSLKDLKDEVSIGRQISHPNVCRLYDLVEADGHHFVVMEYVDGEDLASLLRRIGRLPADKALEIARGLCAGLAAAHDKGVIHRDLKPANVMVDGRGVARIADFGLAAPAGNGLVTGLAGTLAYMAPEQLTGEGASVRSDIFALGLVLFEMFTGRKAFEATSMAALRAVHAEAKPPSLSGSAGHVDPAVERLILRCLAMDPAERPATALAVQAALPGGDPLHAAIALGHTPSPELVAADATVGDIRPAAAWAGLLAGLVGLLAITILGGQVLLFRIVPLTKSPETLADRARDVLTRLGHPDAGADRDYAFITDHVFLDHALQRDSSATRLDALRAARPGPLLFYYRASPGPLVSTRWTPTAPWLSVAPLGVVGRDDPPLDVPGMTMVVLDPQGRLTEFTAVPPIFGADSAPAPDPDFAIALSEAGFDPVRVTPAASQWASPVDSDRRAAWDGAVADQPEVMFHIEAASYRGRIVHFKSRGPWVSAPPPAVVDPALRMLGAGPIALTFAVWMLAAVWARRNLQLGRGDPKGAQRLAIFTFISLTVAQVSLANHTTLPITEFNLLVQIGGQGLIVAALLWLFYIALEPAVRRRWPHSLISWNRLLAGRLRDPLLGRDVLAGMLVGMVLVMALTFDLGNVILGRPPAIAGELGAPDTAREVMHLIFLSPTLGVFHSVAFVFLLCALQALVRRAWLARLLLVLVFFVPAMMGAEALGVSPKFAVLPVVIVWVAVRFGLLASATLIFTFVVLSRAPLTLDWSAWYAGRSFGILAFFAGLLSAAFYVAIGGKPLLGKALFED
jgi:hypothetical protein